MTSVKRDKGILHTHIDPSIPKHEMESVFNPSENESDKVWIRDFPLLWVTNHLRNEGKPMHARIIIHPLSDGSFPQHHKVYLTSPELDLFFHWSFNCNPFSFRSLIKNMKWEITESDVEASRLFEDFGKMLTERVLNCCLLPDRYTAKIALNDKENIATLSFFEVINNYRIVDLLSLELTPTPWKQVLAEVKQDIYRMKDYNSQLKISLIHILDIVSKHQPSLLLSSGNRHAFDTWPNIEAQKWNELVETFLPSSMDSCEQIGLMTESDQLSKKKMFVVMTSERVDNQHVVCSKTVEIETRENGNQYKQSYTFTFYSKGPIDHPHSYAIIVSSQQDLFFQFVADNITKDKFMEITNSLNVDLPIMQKDANTLNSNSSIPFHPKKARENTLGFHTRDGAGGVVGVIVGDCLLGLQNNPERYKAILYLSSDNNEYTEHDSKMDLDDPKSVTSWQQILHHESKKMTPIPSVIDDFEPRKATLAFEETVLFQTKKLLYLEFREANREEIMKKVQERYIGMQMDIQSTQTRLDSILETVRRKNTALRTLIDPIPIPELNLKLHGKVESSHTSKMNYSAKRSLGTSRQKLQGIVFPSPEMENGTSSYLAQPQKSFELHTKEEYPCKIPILSHSIPKGILKHNKKVFQIRSKSPKRNRLFPSLIIHNDKIK